MTSDGNDNHKKDEDPIFFAVSFSSQQRTRALDHGVALPVFGRGRHAELLLGIISQDVLVLSTHKHQGSADQKSGKETKIGWGKLAKSRPYLDEIK